MHGRDTPRYPATAAKNHAFWPDELPLAEAVAFSGVWLVGHQQVTDACLLGLALHRGGVLVTLDERIASLTDSARTTLAPLEFSL